MKRNHFLNRVTLLLVVLFLFVPRTTVAFAAEVDADRTGSISVHLLDSGDHKPVVGAEFTLYKVADLSDVGTLPYSFTADFSACQASLDDLYAESLASELAAYIAGTQAQGTVAVTDEDGTVVFEQLSIGLYLVVQTKAADGYYASSPFLVTLPMTREDGTDWIYDIDASPKVTVLPKEPTSLTVKKVWSDNGKNRPSSVTVQLLQGNEVADTVQLNIQNNWSQTWNDLDASKEWSVKEIDVPVGYRVSYSQTGTVITIINAASLIYTGQLNWPVPLLAIAGLMLFALGWILVFGKRKTKA